MKLWQKSTLVDGRIEAYTVGKDRELDLHLAVFDVLGSLAHIKMLERIGLLEHREWQMLDAELKRLYTIAVDGRLLIDEGVEDIHSQVELMLTKALGDMGKKIHSGRSRNDQVLVDMKMYLRHEIGLILQLVDELFGTLQRQSERYKSVLMPGYTHMQVAMPSSFGLWFGAYAESLKDDTILLKAAFDIVNQNPLGSAAGYGSSFPLDREFTSKLLGFSAPNYNVVYAQMTRGKSEKILAMAMASIAATIGKLSMDTCLYMGQNFGFFTLPDALTTGSSIMPHKKNPDVFELIRANANRLQALPNELALMLTNLPSGYHRDLQLLKECVMPAIHTLKESLAIANYMVANLQVNEQITDDPKYDYLFTVERVNELVLSGVAFRDAYKQVGHEVENGMFVPDRNINHTHLGSIGQLANDKINAAFEHIKSSFGLGEIDTALGQLVGG